MGGMANWHFIFKLQLDLFFFFYLFYIKTSRDYSLRFVNLETVNVVCGVFHHHYFMLFYFIIFALLPFFMAILFSSSQLSPAYILACLLPLIYKADVNVNFSY